MQELTLLFIFMGVIFGTITGLVPGFHVNTLAALLLSILPAIHIDKYLEVVLIVAMSIAHSFVDYIPSILLGAPEEDSVLSVLPGHRLLLEGKGHEALKLTVLGGVGSLALCTGILPLGIKIFPWLYSLSKRILPYMLIAILTYMVFNEAAEKRLYALIVVVYSGILGLIVLGDNALFPTLTGLFGISTLLVSLKNKVKIPQQNLCDEIPIYKRGIVLGTLAGIFAGLFPSVGSSQSAMIMQNFVSKDKKTREFLVALGGVNTVDAIYAFLALYLIGRPRSGTSMAIEKILGAISYQDFIYIIGVILSSAFFAVLITLKLARFFILRITKLRYGTINLITLIFLFGMVFIISGARGILIAIVAGSIGIFAQLSGVKKSNCMAVLIIPTILYFLP